MATELGHLHFQQSKQSPTQFVLYFQTSHLMWNNNQMSENDVEDDSWEVRAFEEDTRGNSLLGCTWPPRSYRCTFCRREFKSAQALGGHMNVHRRDRARLHHEAPPVFPAGAQDFVGNGLCLLYSLPNPNAILIPTAPQMDFKSSDLVNISSTHRFLTDKPRDTAAGIVKGDGVSSLCQSGNTEHDESVKDSGIEEIDLELRLGRRSPPRPCP
ncbi:hypothetical protein CDL12_22600 [Handroanthus impetiginosus]|uniref:C2H2-type domain-containing protein n=1 Tax=Handroanthus impetiginosus TaxID=429701 RepID=A0A2G9GHU8_9LAMI|nr:hypothetical protein CDL12_22600 [Handroanthus impetiginosus]